MGGGRDFLGNKLYRRVGGKYERTQPYKKEYLALIEKLRMEGMDSPTKDEIREILNRFGYRNEQLAYIDQVPVMKDRQEMSIGLAKMAMAYGTDMFESLNVDEENMDSIAYAHAHIYGNPEINLNPAYFVDGRNHDYKYDVESRFHPKGMDNEMLVEHEYAHLLQRRLSGITQKEEQKSAQLRKEISELEKRRENHMSVYYKKLEKINKIDKQINKLEALRGTEKYTADISRKLMKLYDKKFKISDGIEEETKEFAQLLNSLSRASKMNEEITQKVVPANNAHPVIEKLFAKAGADSLQDVALKLTGRDSAYASKNWGEAHAECVADVMRNGKNASKISKDYVREMNKYFKSIK